MSRERQSIEQADTELGAARSLLSQAAENLAICEMVCQHSRRAAEICLRALLAHYRIEFLKTHNLPALLELAEAADLELDIRPADAEWLAQPALLPGDQLKAVAIATQMKREVLDLLAG